MNNTRITFHESYGTLPKSTLRLIKKYNVSPADFDYMTDMLGIDAWTLVLGPEWSKIDEHIVSNSETGMYRPRFF